MNSYHHGNLKQACINQGVDFLRKSKKNFSLRELASVLGVSHGAPGKHFGNKEGLMAEIAIEGFKTLDKYLIKNFNQKALKSSFFDMGKAYIDFALKNPCHYRVMLGEDVPVHENYPELVRVSKETFGRLIHLVEKLQEKGVFRSGDSFQKSYVIWSGIHGLAQLAIEDHVKLPKPIKPNSKGYQKMLRDQCQLLTEELMDSLYKGLQ